jgi:hypothetical protein
VPPESSNIDRRPKCSRLGGAGKLTPLAQLGVGPFDVLAVEEDVRVRKLALDLAPRLLGRTPAQDEHCRPVGRLDLDPTLAAEALAAEDREADHPGLELLRPLLVVDGDDLPDSGDHGASS